MIKIISGSNISELETNINTEPQPYKIIGVGNLSIIIEKPDTSNILASVTTREIYADGSSSEKNEVTKMDGKKTKTNKNFNPDGKEV